MGKLPYMEFFTGDWKKDPALSMCSPATRGIWIDLICAMHDNGKNGTLTGTVEGFSKIARCTPEEMALALRDLEVTATASVTFASLLRHENVTRDIEVTVSCRRLLREAEERKSHAERQKRYRETHSPIRKPKSDAKVTSCLSSSSSSSLETKRRNEDISSCPAQAKTPARDEASEPPETNHHEEKPEPCLCANALGLCERLREKIRANDPAAKVPETFHHRNGWGQQARLLLEADGRPFEEAFALIDWCSADPFWRANVLSMGKFREQYTQLKLKREATDQPRRKLSASEQRLREIQAEEARHGNNES